MKLILLVFDKIYMQEKQNRGSSPYCLAHLEGQLPAFCLLVFLFADTLCFRIESWTFVLPLVEKSRWLPRELKIVLLSPFTTTSALEDPPAAERYHRVSAHQSPFGNVRLVFISLFDFEQCTNNALSRSSKSTNVWATAIYDFRLLDQKIHVNCSNNLFFSIHLFMKRGFWNHTR